MKKINIAKIDEEIFYDKLDNGLEVFFYPRENCQNVYATLTTKFGSIYKSFVPIGKTKFLTVPDGIAHFLEHKIFAQEDGEDVALFFEKSGTSYNAHTSLKSTTYEVSGPNNMIQNILFLLDYVQSPYFTLKNVEMEKGIIKEEINMCNDNPWNILYDKIRYNTFKEDPIRYSISGSTSDIDKINKELLYECYNTFYHPSNMFLVVTGNFDKEQLLKCIKENQDKKNFREYKEVKLKKIKEPNSVYKKDEIVICNTNIPKFSYNIKVPIDNIKDISKRKLMLYLYIVMNILFDETSEFSFKLKEEKIITNNIDFDMLNTDKHILISLINETFNYEVLKNRIEEVLKDFVVCEKAFDRKKKVLISNELFGYDSIVVINNIITDNILFDGKIENDIVSVIESLNMDELNKILKMIDFTNVSTVVVKK